MKTNKYYHAIQKRGKFIGFIDSTTKKGIKYKLTWLSEECKPLGQTFKGYGRIKDQ